MTSKRCVVDKNANRCRKKNKRGIVFTNMGDYSSK